MYGSETALAETFRDTASLFEAGADYQIVKKSILGSMELGDLAFMAKALDNADIYKKALIVPVSHELWQTYGSSLHKNEFVVYYLSKIKDTNIGVLIIEEQPTTFRLEFRSRDVTFNVAKLAVTLGGGGHKNAAGATLRNMSMQEAIQAVKNLL
ncbi:MAG: DHHA1 domain protein [Microgenomates bacterium OLB23]|nr:MAG: DHHA1 domain protein [Microgenomates bacterium OLB23]